MTRKNYEEGTIKRYDEIITEVIHGRISDYWFFRKLQGAVEFSGRIPKSYIYSDEVTYTECVGIADDKASARGARQQIINEIINVLLNQKTTRYGEEMMPDNYARLFHVLAILKLEKDTELLPGITDNYIYNCAYMLWRVDDGSDEAGKSIENATWYMAEELKGRSSMLK